MNKYKKEIYLFLFVSLIIVIGSFAFLFFNFRKQMLLQNEIVQVEKNINFTDSLTNNLLMMESDKRGFQLTGDVEYLKNIYNLKFNSKIILRKLNADIRNDNDSKIISQIDSLVGVQIENLDRGIMIYTTQGFDASINEMKIDGKLEARNLLHENLKNLKLKWDAELSNDVVTINKKSKQNIIDLLILLVVSVLMMFKTADVIKKAQQRIIKRNVQFKEAQSIAKIGSWEWDMITNKLRWSQEQFNLFGEERGQFDLTFEGYLSHLSLKDRENTNALINLAVSKNEKFEVEHEIIRKDGVKVFVFEQGTVQYDQNNNPVAMFGTTQDISERKSVEAKMKAAQQKFKSIFDNTADGIYQSTTDGRFIMANASMAKIFGYDTPEDLINSITNIGKEIYANPAERNKMAEIIMADGHVENYEVQVVTKQKDVIWVSANIRIVRDDNGEIAYFEGTLEDITERIEAENMIKIANERYDQVISATSDGIWEWNFETEKEYFSPQWCEILGFDPDDTSLTHTYTSWEEGIHPNQHAFVLNELNAHLKNKMPFDVEYLHLHTSGEYIWIRIIGKAIFGDDGNALRMAGSIRDVSKRKLAENELLNLSNRLQLALKATSIGIFDWDVVEKSTVWDHEMYRIYDVEPLNSINVTEEWSAAVHPEDLERVNEELKLALSGENEFNSEFRVVWKDKSVHHVKGNALVLRDKDGNPLHMVGTNKDITVEKVAEEEILQLNKSLDQFANITAHDLQEPIRMVSGFLGLLDKKYSEVLDEQGKTYIHRAKDGADRMSILIRDLLEFSRSGNTAAKQEHIELTDVLELVKRDMSIVTTDTNAVIDLPQELPAITGTQSAIYRLFLNLISNGIKFRKKDVSPKVKLIIDEDVDFWKFTLQDNGIGVAQKDQSKLFQAFQRLHRKEVYPGTGLGLVTCKKIVEIHGGKIWMTSVEGEGTAFHFTLPKNGIVNLKTA